MTTSYGPQHSEHTGKGDTEPTGWVRVFRLLIRSDRRKLLSNSLFFPTRKTETGDTETAVRMRKPDVRGGIHGWSRSTGCLYRVVMGVLHFQGGRATRDCTCGVCGHETYVRRTTERQTVGASAETGYFDTTPSARSTSETSPRAVFADSATT
ncbi:hypothetical protein BC835DRAFT_708974 [Cytidiella melzeri]|nr:hypothetical protein BC835DRAFT_708974 [Cytidiella melzeri]